MEEIETQRIIFILIIFFLLVVWFVKRQKNSIRSSIDTDKRNDINSILKMALGKMCIFTFEESYDIGYIDGSQKGKLVSVGKRAIEVEYENKEGNKLIKFFKVSMIKDIEVLEE